MLILHPKQIEFFANLPNKPITEDKFKQSIINENWRIIRETEEGLKLCQLYWDWSQDPMTAFQ
jgi:hypothetical protein